MQALRRDQEDLGRPREASWGWGRPWGLWGLGGGPSAGGLKLLLVGLRWKLVLIPRERGGSPGRF